METYKQRIVELIRYDMDYIPEDLSEKIVYDINFNKSENKDEFLHKINQSHLSILILHAQAETAKSARQINKNLKILLYIIATMAFISIVAGFCFYFMIKSSGSHYPF